MNTQYTTQEILQSSIQNINTLKDHLDKIDELRNDIKNTVKEAENLPIEFNKLVIKIDDSTNKFIQKNQELLKEQIVYFQEKLIDLTIRINKIDELDFSKKFEISKNDFFNNLDNSSVKLNEVIINVEEGFSKSKNDFFFELQKMKSDLENVSKELQSIDLEKHFNKHDKTLSDIFISINNISSSLVSFSNQLNSFLTKANDIENKLIVIENKHNILESKLDVLDKNYSDLNNSIKILTKKNQTSHLINTLLIVIAIITIIVLKFI